MSNYSREVLPARMGTRGKPRARPGNPRSPPPKWRPVARPNHEAPPSPGALDVAKLSYKESSGHESLTSPPARRLRSSRLRMRIPHASGRPESRPGDSPADDEGPRLSHEQGSRAVGPGEFQVVETASDAPIHLRSQGFGFTEHTLGPGQALSHSSAVTPPRASTCPPKVP
jgi:hypothetical protein